MSSREKILNAIAVNKPSLIELKPWVHPTSIDETKLTENFCTVLNSIHVTVKKIDSKNELGDDIARLKSDNQFVIDTINITESDTKNIQLLNADQLEALDYAIMEGEIAVAENGAIWVTEERMINRLLPFICKHLILLIDEEKIVENMHQAYSKISINQIGYAVFISGPSKTADIEQALVIGAQGPLTLAVYILNRK